MNGKVSMQQKMITKRCARAEEVIEKIAKGVKMIASGECSIELSSDIIEMLVRDYYALYPNRFAKP